MALSQQQKLELMVEKRVQPDNAPVEGSWVAAVSGGGDSIALLVAMHASGWDKSHLHVVCVNHKLRDAAASEQAYVHQRCLEYGLTFTAVDLEVDPGPRPASSEKLRKLRYQALNKIKNDKNASGIVAAHTLDDQQETQLIALMRGSGLPGLAGMSEWQSEIWRPLLGVSRQQLRDYLILKNIAWYEDHSNLKMSSLRSRIRHIVRPAIARPMSDHQYLRAKILQDENDFLSQQALYAYRKCTEDGMLELARFRLLPIVIQRRVLRLLSGQPSPEANRIEELRLICNSDASRLRACNLGRHRQILVGSRYAVPMPQEVESVGVTVVPLFSIAERVEENVYRQFQHQLENRNILAEIRSIWPVSVLADGAYRLLDWDYKNQTKISPIPGVILEWRLELPLGDEDASICATEV